MTFSWAVMDTCMRLVDAVDELQEADADPLLLATRPDIVERWAALSADEEWTYLKVLAHRHAHADPPRDLPNHQPGEGLDYALALQADARGTELLGEWHPAIEPPSKETGLMAAVLFVTAVRTEVRAGALRRRTETGWAAG
ncbi:hypothetical protein [Streptomyces cucumeris]|uniref:hypothetical protein n=1 Tax=Streptomyces cucumeris TaxID=2962890 RepID=UPI0020C918A2|nr:hypothetical protein [Streptomyces sp. NEAU-Y11]MCP9205480.1 hypothetical protein [Streptomyces sp. NEAU-Y11]